MVAKVQISCFWVTYSIHTYIHTDRTKCLTLLHISAQGNYMFNVTWSSLAYFDYLLLAACIQQTVDSGEPEQAPHKSVGSVKHVMDLQYVIL